ncbi:hypothetical protein Tco_0195326 [Tanacetum coccineum]
MQHSHSNDDTCFRMDVIDEVTKEELDALLDDSEPFLSTSEKINETTLDKEFKEFMAVDVEETPKQEEEVEDNFEELPLKGILRIKTSIEDPLTDLEMNPLPKYLEYAFLEKDSLLPVVIYALLKDNEKKRLVSDDVKPVIQRQRRLNQNMKKVVNKEIIKLLDAGIIYPIEDSPWVSLIHCVPKKGGMTVVINKKNKLVPKLSPVGVFVLTTIHYSCLSNLEQMLIQCKQAHLVLNWEKCHFMVTEGIVLDHSALKYLFAKQDAKPHIIRWILLLQEFDIEIKNKKGAENVATDHLSRLENPNLKELRDEDIDDNFPDETLMNFSSNDEDEIPWFADFANYLVGKILRRIDLRPMMQVLLET